MSIPIDPSFITLQQWMSPAFPIGSFAYSHGLETAIAMGHVTTGDQLFDWLTDLVGYGAAGNDAKLLALSCLYDDPWDLNDRALALCSSNERIIETQTQGAAFARVLQDVWNIDLDGLVFPVALGQAVRAQGIDPRLAVLAYLHGFCSNLVAAAVRMVPLGQTVGQRVLHRLTPFICAQTDCAMTADLDDLTSVTFLSDVTSMRHETSQPRIFKT